MKDTMELKNTPQKEQQVIFNKQKAFFQSHQTKPYEFRKNQLKKLKEVIEKHETEVLQALSDDFGKPSFESYVTEVGFMYEEIKYYLKHLKSWMEPKNVSTSLMHFPSKSKVFYEPKGVTLIVGPWNYPFQLLMAPVVAAIAAGNTCMIKPPEETPHTSALVKKMIRENFEEDFLAVIMGEGKVVVPELMENNTFNHIFFTGSVPVGKIIAKMAAEKLMPTTLELGGKSPAIIDKKANLEISARRIIFGKMMNAGQTCVAPDYLMVHESVKAEFVDELKACIIQFYGISPLESPDLTQIVNKKRYETLKGFLKEGNIIFGGAFDDEKRKIEPTLVENVNEEDQLFKEEIFGPILPIFSFINEEEVYDMIAKNPNPLSLYLFTESKKAEKNFIHKIPFGGGAINNTVVHLSNPGLPFGGIGNSGQGNYHGKAGFKTFSHEKSIMKSGTWFDLRKKYPPFNSMSMKIIKKFMNP